MCSVVGHFHVGVEDFVFSRDSIFMQGHLCPVSAFGDSTVDLCSLLWQEGVLVMLLLEMWSKCGSRGDSVSNAFKRDGGMVCDLSVYVCLRERRTHIQISWLSFFGENVCLGPRLYLHVRLSLICFFPHTLYLGIVFGSTNSADSVLPDI